MAIRIIYKVGVPKEGARESRHRCMKIPQALADLLNKTDEGFICFAFMWPAKVIRVIAKKDFTTFRVERFTRTNRDNADPKGSWHTLATLGDPVPGMMLGRAMEAAVKEQKDLIAREQRKAQKIMGVPR